MSVSLFTVKSAIGSQTQEVKVRDKIKADNENSLTLLLKYIAVFTSSSPY
jgi:hypothetical protein